MDQVAVVPVVSGAAEVDEGMSVVSVMVCFAAAARVRVIVVVGVDERHPGGASGVVVLAVTELYLDAVSVARFCVEPPVVAV